MVGKERIVPQIPIDPLLQREIGQCEGSDVLEDIVLPEKKKKFLVFLSAPLQPTTRKSAFQHIIEVVRIASTIEGATYKERKVVCFIPHTELLIKYNEFEDPGLRIPAIGANMVIVEHSDMMITIGRRRSPGMKGEIDTAKHAETPTMSFAAFKRHLTNLPTEAESQETFARIIRSLPPELFTEELLKKKVRRK